MQPKISIVTAAYNATKYLRQTLDGVLSQTETNWEMIVVDDGSKDDTAEIVTEYMARDARFRLIKQSNAGQEAALNRGYAEITSPTPYVIFLDADDVWKPGALEKLRQALEAHPEAVGAHGLADYIDSEGHPTDAPMIDAFIRNRVGVVNERVVPIPNSAPTTFSVLATRQCIATPGAVLLRRSALDPENLFGPPRFVADWELWIRTARRGFFAYLDEAIIWYRQHPNSRSNNYNRIEKDSFDVWRIAVTSAENTPEQRRDAVVSWRHGHKSLAYQRLCWTRWAIQRGQPLNALKQLRHAGLHYLESVFVPPMRELQS